MMLIPYRDPRVPREGGGGGEEVLAVLVSEERKVVSM